MDIIQELLKLIKINTKISALDSSEDILKEIMNEAMSLTGTARAFILDVYPSRDVKCLSEYRSKTVELAVETGWSKTSTLEAHDLKRAVYSTHALESSEAAPSILKGNIQTVISAPLAADERSAMVLQLAGQDATRIDPQTLSLLNLLVSQAQVTISKSRLEKAALRNAAMAATGELATQVAHDIRSPLAALEAAAGDTSQLPEDKRALIRGALGRIRDIANSLMLLSGAATDADALDVISPQLLSNLIESLVSEKRMQFRSRTGVVIETRFDAAPYGLFSNVQRIEFMRLLSNLINNAIEAFDDECGSVRVSLALRDGRALVSVQDDGKGIPSELLARLGRRGETHGKAGGAGLGLYHAKKSVESWGGRLEITSEIGKGAAVAISLPQSSPPSWFVSTLQLSPGCPLVILDDDTNIHRVWRDRLDALLTREHDIEVAHTHSPDEIRRWVVGAGERASKALYLLDYELMGYQETGLSLADELAIGDRSILVTNRDEESEVQEGCRRLKVRLIPKGLLGLVPIRIVQHLADRADPVNVKSMNWDAILIDDDPLVRKTWQVAADLAKKHLRVFASANKFFLEAESLSRDIPVYIDAALGNDSRGEIESRLIHALGFRDIYLATGHKVEEFSAYSHLRGVVGKSPPWTC